MIANIIFREHSIYIKSFLELFPLKFKDSLTENQYFFHPLKLNSSSHYLFTYILALISFTSVFLTLSVAFFTDIIPLKSLSTFYFLTSIIFLVLIAWLISLTFSMSYKISSYRLHFVSFTFLLTVIFTTLKLDIGRLIPQHTLKSIFSPDHIFLKIFSTSLVLCICSIPLCLERFFTYYWQTEQPQKAYLCFQIILYLLYLGCLKCHRMLNFHVAEDITHNDDFFHQLLLCFESFILLVCFGTYHVFQWIERLRLLVEFRQSNTFKRTLNSNQYSCINTGSIHIDNNMRRQKKCQSNAVEDLLHLISRASACIEGSQNTCNDPSLKKSSQLLKKLQKSLTNTDNLYAVRLTRHLPIEDSTGETYKDTNEKLNDPFESALLESQMFEIFACHKTNTSNYDWPFDTSTQSDSKGNVSNSEIYSLHDKNDGKIAHKNFPVTVNHLNRHLFRYIGKQWNWNAFEASKDYPNILVEVGSLLLEPASVFLQTSSQRICNYIYHIQRLYCCNPFHNVTHGVMVLHNFWCLLKMLRIDTCTAFTPLDSVAVTIACLGHDVGHPGRTNEFLRNTFNKMAFLYNDRSLLENYRCALVFKCLENDNCDILELLHLEDRKKARKKIIDLMLATDMDEHFEHLSKFCLRIQAEDFNFLTDYNDLWLVLRMCMKCADLSHEFVEWDQHLDWELRLAEEFYQQGEEEKSLGLKMSPLCDRKCHYDFPRFRCHYIDFVVLPMLTKLQELKNTEEISETCMPLLLSNKKKWNDLLLSNDNIQIPDCIQHIRTHPFVCRPFINHLLIPKECSLAASKSTNMKTKSLTLDTAITPDDIAPQEGLLKNFYSFPLDEYKSTKKL